MQEIAENLPITEGVDRLMYVLKKYGYKIAILSGGFTYFGQHLQKKYGIDYVYANELEIIDGKLTGRYLGDVVDGKRKARTTPFNCPSRKSRYCANHCRR